MAECILKDLVQKRGITDAFVIRSAATSTEEIGCPIHRGTKMKLTEKGVPLCDHRAVQLCRSDYDEYDLILGMDKRNIQNILKITGGDPAGKVRRLLDFSETPRDIADPWYTGNFDITYEDITEGCEALLKYLAAKF